MLKRCGSVATDSQDFEARMEMALYMDSKGVEDEDVEEGWHAEYGYAQERARQKTAQRRREKDARSGGNFRDG